MSQAIFPTNLEPGQKIIVVYKSETPDEHGYFVSIQKDDQLKTFDSVILSDNKHFLTADLDDDHEHFKEIPLIDIYEIKVENEMVEEVY